MDAARADRRLLGMVKVVTRDYTFTAAERVLLSTIMDRPAHTWIGSLAVRAARGNADDVFWADEGGEMGGYIGPGEAVTFDFGQGQTLVREFTLYGDVNDVIYITIGINSNHTDPYVMLNG